MLIRTVKILDYAGFVLMTHGEEKYVSIYLVYRRALAIRRHMSVSYSLLGTCSKSRSNSLTMERLRFFEEPLKPSAFKALFSKFFETTALVHSRVQGELGPFNQAFSWNKFGYLR